MSEYVSIKAPPQARQKCRAWVTGWRHQRGAVTLMGAMVVVVIFTIALAAALGYARNTSTTVKNQASAQGLVDVLHAVQKAYQHRTTYAGFTLDAAIDEGLVPKSMADPSGSSWAGTQLRTLPNGDAWGIMAFPYGSTRATRTVMVVRTQSPDSCIEYGHALMDDAWQLALGGFMSSNYVIGPQRSPPLTGGALYSAIAQQCSGVAGRGFMNDYVIAIF